VHSPRHVRTFADLSDEELGAVATAWTQRVETARGGGFGYVHVFINEGRAAGASLAHTHSQLVWLREPPPEAVREHVSPRELRAGELDVAETDALAAFCHPAGRLPYETLIVGAKAEPWPGQETLAAALRLLRTVVRALREVEGPVPWNAWLHHGGEWHLELVPRLAILAGVELGAGIYVNTVAPEDAAAALRAAATSVGR
jgi:UDPglucose--hexose-1-phosphate uridylyltransferase